jgi:hypothetical protein
MYEGDWREGKRHGTGKYYFRDGAMYEGGIRDNKIHGDGTLYHASGGMYQGEYREDKKHGTGTLTFGQNCSTAAGWEWAKPGDVYHGPPVDNNRHRIAQWTHAKDSTTERPQCRNDTLVGCPNNASDARSRELYRKGFI